MFKSEYKKGFRFVVTTNEARSAGHSVVSYHRSEREALKKVIKSCGNLWYYPIDEKGELSTSSDDLDGLRGRLSYLNRSVL